MKLYYTYIIECSDGSYYVGVTNDLSRRINQHNNEKNPKSWCYGREPVELRYYAEFTEVHMAISHEKQLKGWSRAKKEALFEAKWEQIVQLSKSKTTDPSTSSG